MTSSTRKAKIAVDRRRYATKENTLPPAENNNDLLTPLAEARASFLIGLLNPEYRPGKLVRVYKRGTPSYRVVKAAHPSKTSLRGLGVSTVAMANDPAPVGIVCAGAPGKHGNAARSVAEKIMGLDLAGDVGVIVSYQKNDLSDAAACADWKAAEELGIRPIYDPEGALGTGFVDVTGGCLRFEHGNATVSYVHPPFEEMAYRTLLKVLDSTMSKAQSLSRSLKYGDAPVEQVAYDLSFQKWSFDELHEAVEHARLRSAGEAGEPGQDPLYASWDGAAWGRRNSHDKDSIEKFKLICDIWKAVLAARGLTLSYSAAKENGNLEDTGKMLGIDYMIDAVLEGAGRETVLAGIPEANLDRGFDGSALW